VSTYKCCAVIKDKTCGRKAIAAYYRGGWRFLCSSHVDLINAQSERTRETLIWLTEESPYELLYRSLPGGEDR
jgi:hypothetical protein